MGWPTGARPAGARCTLVVLWVVLLALLPGPARADDMVNCASVETKRGTDATESPEARLQRMLAAVPVCQKDALFLATLGQLLNGQGRYLEAADHLERALMLEPDLKDAQFSYAVALTASGDVLASAALLDNLLADPSLPTPLRTLILRQKAALFGAVEPRGWQSRVSLATRVGYDSNLLGSPNLASLTLTLSGQTLVLPLDESYLAHGGGYARADAQLDLHRIAPDGAHWDAMVSLRSRYSPAVQKAGSTQVDLLLERSHYPHPQALLEQQHVDANAPGVNLDSFGSYFNASASGLQAQGGTRYTAWGAAGGLARAGPRVGAADCQARVGVEWQERKYLDNQVLSGRYIGLATSWSCEQPSGAQWLVGFKAGHDAAQDPARAGANQQQLSLRLAGIFPLESLAANIVPTLAPLRRGRLLLDVEQSQQTDSIGYSPILDSGRTRTVLRKVVHLEYQHPLSRAAQWVLGAEWAVQVSSLQFFRQNSWGGYTAVRVSW